MKNALYFSLWLFPPKELVTQQQEKVANGRDGSSLSLLVCFYCKANLSCFIVPKLKPGLEVPVLSGSSCRAVPRPGGTVFEAACCLFKENEGASEGLTPGSSAAFQRCHLCACDITGEKIGNPFSRIESSW